jgi:hypothetical protein
VPGAEGAASFTQHLGKLDGRPAPQRDGPKEVEQIERSIVDRSRSLTSFLSRGHS